MKNRYTRRETLIGGSALMAAAACSQTQADQSQDLAEMTGKWIRLADMPFPVQEIYPSVFERNGEPFIVNAGGFDFSLSLPISKAVSIYDPARDEWRLGTDLPAARHHISLAFDGTHLHAFGGFAFKGKDVWEMRTEHWQTDDPESGIWEVAPPLPTPRAEGMPLALNGKIHMIGGRHPKGEANNSWQDQTDTGMHMVYDPGIEQWSDLAPLPMPRNSGTGAVLDGKLYVISGRTVADGNTPACHVYDPANDAWSEIATLPEPIQQASPHGQGGLACGVSNGKIVAFGGEWFEGDGGVYADTWIYDPESDVWTAGAPMTTPRHGLGAVTLYDGIYALGGALQRGGNGTSAVLERFSI